MTKKYLQDWYNQGNISYSEKTELNKIEVGDYGYHYLEDLKQMLRCKNWTREKSEIRNKLNDRIKRIIFFTPNFNNDKLDISNYSCAIVTDGNDQVWIVSYRPSYVANIESDLVVKKVSISASEAEANLNGSYPIFVAEGSLSLEGVVLSNTLNNPLLSKSYVNRKFFYLYEIKSNPDEYILPLDIVTRPINSNLDHYAVYLGNKQVAELPGYGLTQIISWSEFCNPSSSSSGFSSSSSSGSGMMGLVHSRIPFKRKEIIVKHIDKAIRHGYGLCGCHTYNSALNNCENLVNAWVLGFNVSAQGLHIGGGSPGLTIGFSLFSSGLSSTINSVKNAFTVSTPIIPWKYKIINQSNNFEDLNSRYSSQRERIESYINQAENNRSYTRSKYQIRQEKFEERIEVYPKDWCRIS